LFPGVFQEIYDFPGVFPGDKSISRRFQEYPGVSRSSGHPDLKEKIK